MRLTTTCRAKALEAGLWQESDGRMIRLADMPAADLVNALLDSLVAGEPKSITAPLAREVRRRRLEDDAFAEIARRRSDGSLG